MTTPKFAVGEGVILQSLSRPEFNGERTVLSVLRPGQACLCPISGRRFENGCGTVVYILDDGHIEPDGFCALWGERTLRKRHQPGEYSWQDLKTILNLPVSRTELARLDREVAGA